MSAEPARHLRGTGSRSLWVAAFLALWTLPQLTRAIVQGIADSGNTYGTVCALVNEEPPGSGAYAVSCSSVLISPSILLSAAHCADKFEYVSCDSSVAGTPQLLNVSSRTTATGYSAVDDSTQDLLVIKLVQGAPNSGAAALPTQQQLDDLKEAGSLNSDQAFTIVGYGSTFSPNRPNAESNGPRNKDRYYTPATFYSLNPNRLRLSVPLASGVSGSICGGDSGGPVFYAPTGILVGITVKADDLCSTTAIANRLDTPIVRRWLAEQGVQVP